MRLATETSAELCLRLLQQMRADWLSRQIYSDGVRIIDTMISRRLELEWAFNEINTKLSGRQQAIYRLFDMLVINALFLNKDEARAQREARRDMRELHQKVAKLATQLGEALEDIHDISNSAGFFSETHYHVADLIDEAAASNLHYTAFLKQELELLRSRYDLKYWPAVHELIYAIACDAHESPVVPNRPDVAILTEGKRASHADFVRTLLHRIKDEATGHPDAFPEGFELSDTAVSALLNCIFDQDGDRGLDAAYVKNIRHRQRKKLESD